MGTLVGFCQSSCLFRGGGLHKSPSISDLKPTVSHTFSKTAVIILGNQALAKTDATLQISNIHMSNLADISPQIFLPSCICSCSVGCRIR